MMKVINLTNKCYDTVEGNKKRLFFQTSPQTFHSILFCISDALHTYFGLCGLSLMVEPGLNAIHSALNITQRAANHLKKLHNQTIR